MEKPKPKRDTHTGHGILIRVPHGYYDTLDAWARVEHMRIATLVTRELLKLLDRRRARRKA